MKSALFDKVASSQFCTRATIGDERSLVGKLITMDVRLRHTDTKSDPE